MKTVARLNVFVVPLLFGCISSACKNAESARGVVQSQPTEVSQKQSPSPRLSKLGSVPSEAQNNTLHCINRQICWVNSGQSLLKTNNSGRTWEVVYSGTAEEELGNIAFTDQLNGWRSNKNGFFITSDGGGTWAKQLSTPLDQPNGVVNHRTIRSDGAPIFVAGGLYRQLTKRELEQGAYATRQTSLDGKSVLEQAIFYSNDGELIWQRAKLRPIVGTINFLERLGTIQLLALSNVSVYYSTDNGLSWRKSNFSDACIGEDYFENGYEGKPSGLFFKDSKTGWLCFNDGRILKAVDGGQHWCDVAAPSTMKFDREGKGETHFVQIVFVGDEKGYGLSNAGLLYKTSDGGHTWSKVYEDLLFEDVLVFDGKEILLISSGSLFLLTEKL